MARPFRWWAGFRWRRSLAASTAAPVTAVDVVFGLAPPALQPLVIRAPRGDSIFPAERPRR